MGNTQKSTRIWTYFCSSAQDVDSLAYLSKTMDPSSWTLVKSFDVSLQEYILGLVPPDDKEETVKRIREAASNQPEALRDLELKVKSCKKDSKDLPSCFVVDVVLQLYDNLGDPARSRNDDPTVTICCYQGDFFVQATTDLNLPKLFELFCVPFQWGKTKVRAFIFPEIIFGCPNYTLIFALPLNDSSTEKSDGNPLQKSENSEIPVLVTPLKEDTLTQIFFSLTLREIANFSNTNHAWHTWITKNGKLWKKKHDEIWSLQPVPILPEMIGWHLVVVLKKIREKEFKKGLCAKFNEFDIDLGKIVKKVSPRGAGELFVRVFNCPIAVLRAEEVNRFVEILTEMNFLEIFPGMVQRLYLNNLKFYFSCCAKENLPMFVLYQGNE